MVQLTELIWVRQSDSFNFDLMFLVKFGQNLIEYLETIPYCCNKKRSILYKRLNCSLNFNIYNKAIKNKWALKSYKKINLPITNRFFRKSKEELLWQTKT